jgi:hypothetical protein
MVVLLTPNLGSGGSDYVRREVEYALSSPRFEGRLIPVVLGSKDAAWLDNVPWVLLKLRQVVRGGEFEKALVVPAPDPVRRLSRRLPRRLPATPPQLEEALPCLNVNQQK